MIMICDLIETYEKIFQISKVSIINLFLNHIAVMCISTVYKASVDSEILHAFSSSNSTFICLFRL